MGQYLLPNGMTFKIYVEAPTGYVISTTTIGVAKVKRTVETNGVEYEHLSIRASTVPYAAGCKYSNDDIEWSQDAAGECTSGTVLLVFPFILSVRPSEITEPKDIEFALEVNFEFYINSHTFITPNVDKLSSEEVTLASGGTMLNTNFARYLTLTNTLSEKLFEIICPRDRTLLKIVQSVCPFEGILPAQILIDSSVGSESKNYDLNLPQRLKDLNIQIRRTPDKDSNFVNAPMNNMSYIIKRKPGIITYVIIEKAFFENCEYPGLYRTNSQNTRGCDPAKILADPGWRMGPEGGICDNYPYANGFEAILQNDELHVTQVNAQAQTRTSTVYNLESQISDATGPRVYELSDDDDSLEIDMFLDANGCTQEATKVHITINTVTPTITTPQLVVDRLIAFGDTVLICAPSENSACKVPNSETAITWPVDECNRFVNQQTGECNEMGINFDSQSITYNVYITNMAVTADTVAVGKLKNSRPFDSSVPLVQTGAQYPYMSIRAIASPTCYGVNSVTLQHKQCLFA